MFELNASQFQKGVFDIYLEEEPPRIIAWAIKAGPHLGRAFALSFILMASFLTMNAQPSRWLMAQGYLDSWTQPQILYFQKSFTWGIFFFGIFIYMATVFFQKRALALSFHRSSQRLDYELKSMYRRLPSKKGTILFSDFSKLEVYSPFREPQSPYGYIALRLKNGRDLKAIEFKVLSEDQLKIYPKNLGQILDLEPQGDWQDPADKT